MRSLERAGSWRTWASPDVPVRLGVSSCLLGSDVRYDGGHCRDRFLTNELGPWVEYVSVCPEMELGLPVPRPILHLEDTPEGRERLVMPGSGEDWTARMEAFAARRVDELRALELDGYVLKKNSPSCGVWRVKVHSGRGGSRRDGMGVFARVLAERWPELPVEEDGRLNDLRLRENFVERAFCRNRLRVLEAQGVTRGRLVEFHAAHKMLLRAHDEAGYRELGRVVGAAGSVPDGELFARYKLLFHSVLERLPSPKRHVNVLQHMFGYLKDLLTPPDKRQLLAALEDYRQGWQPLVVPLSLLRFHVEKHGIEYLLGQLYLDPHPKELVLRKGA